MYTIITAADIREFFKPEKGWIDYETETSSEMIMECHIPFAPIGVVVRVYTSVPTRSGYSRKKGTDAIRVCVVDKPNNRGLMSLPHVKRMDGWREQVKDRVRTAYTEMRHRLGPLAK